ncbi:MAG: exodeoxyribonuclease V subunit gamma, partial [Candidatus Saccharimonas sp.]|nr:exodeoxyribonuclease V subunit gamma [Planctomycetaceae bacterium]
FADFTRTQSEILGLLMGWIARATITLPLEQPTTRNDLFAKPEVALAQLQKHLPDGATCRIESLLADQSKSGVRGQESEVRKSLIESLSADNSTWQPGLVRIVQGLFANPRTNQPTDDAAGIELIAATGPVGECEAVARRIKHLLESGVAPKQIVVALRSISDDGPAWNDFLTEAGIPTWCEAKLPLAASPVVKALFSLLQLELENWPFARLMSVLDSNLFQPLWPEAQSCRAVRSVAAALRRLKLHAGRDLMLRVLSRVATGLIREESASVSDEDGEDALPVSESSAAEIAAIAEPLLARLSHTTERLRRKHTLADWADVLATLGGELGWSRGGLGVPGDTDSLEARDWDLLQRIVRTAAEADEKLASSPDAKPARKLPLLDLAEFTAELRDLLSGETIPITADPGGCVRVLDVEQVRHLSVPHLFVVGLSESSFPQNRADDCLFGDTERRDLAARGLALRHREQHQQDEMFLFYNLVTKARASLTLSYPAINRKGQPVFPSPYVTA